MMVVDKPECYDVFINHRRIDTNKNVAGLLYDHLARQNLRPFLDSKTMKPGDKLFEKIGTALHGCKVHKLHNLRLSLQGKRLTKNSRTENYTEKLFAVDTNSSLCMAGLTRLE